MVVGKAVTKASWAVVGNYPADKRLERMLTQTGFYDLLGVKSRDTGKLRRDVDYIVFRSDTRLDSAQPRKLRNDLLGENAAVQVRVRSRLYRALTEAMINVGQHAYPINAAKLHPLRGRWWVAGQVNRRRKEMMITFCDLGVGIPVTLPKVYTWELIRAVLALLPGINPNDGQMIQAGMAIGRSSTGQQHRGRGLNDLRQLIDQIRAGELYIFSGRGRYVYGANGSEAVRNYGISMGGTLIKWSMPLDAFADLQDEVIDGSEKDN